MSLIRLKYDIVFDCETGLIWQDDYMTLRARRTFYEAEEFLETFNLASSNELYGWGDWRLPSIDELISLYAMKSKLKHVNIGLYYWSSTKAISFNSGDIKNFEKSMKFFVRLVRDSKMHAITYEEFLHAIEVTSIVDNTIILKNISHIFRNTSNTNDRLLWVKKDNENYVGTVEEIILQLNLVKQPALKYDKNDILLFEQIPDMVQRKLEKQIEELPTIQKQEVPKFVEIIKDEFETQIEYNLRVEQSKLDYENCIIQIEEGFQTKVKERELRIDEIKSNFENIKRSFFFETFREVMFSVVISKASYQIENKMMCLEITTSNNSWSKTVSVYMPDRDFAKRFKENLNEVDIEVIMKLCDDNFLLTNVRFEFENKKLEAILDIVKRNESSVSTKISLDDYIEYIDTKNFEHKSSYTISVKTLEMDALLNETKKAHFEINELKDSISKANEITLKQNILIKEADDEKLKLNASLKSAEKEKSNYKNELLYLKQDRDKLHNKCELLVKQIEKASEETIKLNASLKSAEKEKSNYKNELLYLKQDRDKLHNKCELLVKQIEKASEETIKLNASLKEADDINKQNQLELTDLKKLSTKILEKDLTIESFKKHMINLEEEIRLLKVCSLNLNNNKVNVTRDSFENF